MFNGDADGLCALQQLRLAEPAEATLVTGVKRDIRLLERVAAGAEDRVTVLDISLAANRTDLDRLLAAGARVRWFDHHDAGDVPSHPNLQAHIDESAQVCSSLIVDRALGHRFVRWAITAAYGDNLPAVADALAERHGLDPAQRAALRGLGENLNYNAYGDHEDDLLVHPAQLHRAMRGFADPFDFLAGSAVCATLDAGRRADLDQASALRPANAHPRARVFVLPDARWCRRVRGIFGNLLSNDAPDSAHAILSPDERGGYVVSVRAPRTAPSGAAEFCRGFPGGNGRAAAAGINHLPADDLPAFVQRFEQVFGQR